MEDKLCRTGDPIRWSAEPTVIYKWNIEMMAGCIGSQRGLYYCLRMSDNITTSEGRNPALFTQPKRKRRRWLHYANTSYCSKESVSALQRKLYQKAKQQSGFRFHSFYDKVCRNDVLQRAYDLVKQNKGSPGLDGITFKIIEQRIGILEKCACLRWRISESRMR